MLSQMNSVRTFTIYVFQAQFNTVLPLKASLSTSSPMNMAVEVMQTPDGVIRNCGAPTNNI
jgi:hypothetical protein